MLIDNVVMLIVALWNGFVEVLNSSFASAFIASLAGAGFGAWGALHVAERSSRKQDLLASFRQASSAAAYSEPLLVDVMNFHDDFLKGFVDDYTANKLQIETTIAQGAKDGVHVNMHVNLSFTELTLPRLPIDKIHAVFLATAYAPGTVIRAFSMIERAEAGLSDAIAHHNALLHDALKLSPNESVRMIYGLELDGGNVDMRFYNTVDALKGNTEDLLFFTGEFIDATDDFLKKLADKLEPLSTERPRYNRLDISRLRASGEIPCEPRHTQWRQIAKISA